MAEEHIGTNKNPTSYRAVNKSVVSHDFNRTLCPNKASTINLIGLRVNRNL